MKFDIIVNAARSAVLARQGAEKGFSMKEYMKTNRILFILIGLAVLVSVVVVGNRWLAESGNKTYDVVLDYNELELLAEQSEEDITWWLEQFRDMGPSGL